MVFGLVVNDGDSMPPFILHGLRLNIESYIKFLPEKSWSRLKKWLLEEPTSSNRVQHHDAQARETNSANKKIPATTSSLTSNRLTLQIATPLIITRGTRLSERPTKQVTPKIKASITAVRGSLNKFPDFFFSYGHYCFLSVAEVSQLGFFSNSLIFFYRTLFLPWKSGCQSEHSPNKFSAYIHLIYLQSYKNIRLKTKYYFLKIFHLLLTNKLASFKEETAMHLLEDFFILLHTQNNVKQCVCKWS